jgi:hypothetical protein
LLFASYEAAFIDESMRMPIDALFVTGRWNLKSRAKEQNSFATDID